MENRCRYRAFEERGLRSFDLKVFIKRRKTRLVKETLRNPNGKLKFVLESVKDVLIVFLPFQYKTDINRRFSSIPIELFLHSLRKVKPISLLLI